jgi:hypothetical protein
MSRLLFWPMQRPGRSAVLAASSWLCICSAGAAESRAAPNARAAVDSRVDTTSAHEAALPSSNELRKTETSGLGLSAGLGSQYPIVGLQAAYYVQMPHSLFRVTPYAGVGAGLCNTAPRGDCATGWVLGAMGSWGHQHRIMFDAFYGTVNAYWFSFHGEAPETRAVPGAGLAVGYEYMAFSGFFVRTDVGGTYAFGPPITAAKNRFGLALTLIGVGYKFW